VFETTGSASPLLDTRIVTLSVICCGNPVFAASAKIARFNVARRFLARESPSRLLRSACPTLSVWPSRHTVRIALLGSVTHELTMIFASSLIRGPCLDGTAEDRNAKSSNGFAAVSQPITADESTGGSGMESPSAPAFQPYSIGACPKPPSVLMYILNLLNLLLENALTTDSAFLHRWCCTRNDRGVDRPLAII